MHFLCRPLLKELAAVYQEDSLKDLQPRQMLALPAAIRADDCKFDRQRTTHE